VKRFLGRLRRAVWAVYNDGGLGYAKGAAYSALLSFFPVLTTLTTFLVQANAEAVSRKIANFLSSVTPPGTQELLRYAMTERGARPASLPVAAGLLAVWAASGVMISLLDGFQAAYLTPDRRGAVHKRLVAMALVFISVLPVVAASSVLIFGDKVEDSVLHFLGVLKADQSVTSGVHQISRVVRSIFSFAVTVLVTALLYAYGPSPRRRLRTVWNGAILATALWLLVTLGFAWYVSHIANYNVLYGSIGTVIALLVWMYLVAVIVIIGCEYNAVSERRK